MWTEGLRTEAVDRHLSKSNRSKGIFDLSLMVTREFQENKCSYDTQSGNRCIFDKRFGVNAIISSINGIGNKTITNTGNKSASPRHDHMANIMLTHLRPTSTRHERQRAWYNTKLLPSSLCNKSMRRCSPHPWSYWMCERASHMP